MVIKLAGVTKREFYLTKSEAQQLRYMLNELKWANCRGRKSWMIRAQAIHQKIDRFVMPTKGKGE